jgi:hypothetical protein
MSLLARAHASRVAHTPLKPSQVTYVGPVDPRHGHLSGWVADLIRKQSPEYRPHK